MLGVRRVNVFNFSRKSETYSARLLNGARVLCVHRKFCGRPDSMYVNFISYSLRQSIRTRRPTPTSGPEESTVQIDVEEMDVDGVSLRVYDCAGQVECLLVLSCGHFAPAIDVASPEFVPNIVETNLQTEPVQVCFTALQVQRRSSTRNTSC